MDAADDQKLVCAHLVESPGDTQDEATSIDFDPTTAISELQDVFGALLMTDRKTEPTPSYHKWNLRSWRTPYKAPPPLLPKWTGSFALLSFPREIRDTIYFHYVFRYRGIMYRSNNATTEYSAPTENQMLSLFLTCRQVYEEALQVSCRYNQIEVPRKEDRKHRDYGKAPSGLLRLFPEKPRNLIQRVRYTCGWSEEHETFLQLLEDAHTFKAEFPLMREFTASWATYGDKILSSLNIQENRHEENVQAWLRWMRFWIGKSKVMPAPWIKFQFAYESQFSPEQRHAGSLNEAYGILVRQRTAAVQDMADVEESGRKWIEEMGKERKRKKRSSR
jgi:hypothetical protein